MHFGRLPKGDVFFICHLGNGTDCSGEKGLVGTAEDPRRKVREGEETQGDGAEERQGKIYFSFFDRVRGSRRVGSRKRR